MENYCVLSLAKEKGTIKAIQIIVENLWSTELSFVMLFNHEMSIPHKARYQYIKLLELAFGIGICAWIFYRG